MKAAEMFSLQGRVALVTGASSGLGTQFAKALADNGAAVALVARRADRLKALKDEIEGKGGKAIAIEADVTDRAAMTRAFDAAEKAFGTVTILVNNAGIAQSARRAIEVTEEEWRKVLSVDLDAVFYNAQEAARRMLAANKKGAIVNIASVLGFGVAKGVAAYAVAKAAVVQVTKALAVELAFKGVRVNAIAPGWFVTEINDKYLTRRSGRRAQARDPDGPLRQGRRSRRRAAALGVRRRQLHHRRDRRGRWRPGGDDFRVRKQKWTSRFLPKSNPSACACATSSTSTCCRSKPIRRISPTTRTSRTSGWRRCARRPRRPACGRRSRRKEFGGMGLPIVGWPAIYEEASRSIFGSLAIHCMAPDDGNMNLLAKAGTPAQKDKWLRPSPRARCARPSS